MITKPKNKKENSDRWEEELFINRVIQGDYVLLIGSQNILSYNCDEFLKAEGNSTRFLLNRTISEINKNYRINTSDYNSFTELSYFINDIDEYVLDSLDEIEPELHDVSKDLIELIKSKCFKVIITTTVDPFIEEVMREVYGDELVVMDIFSNDINKFDLNDDIQYTKPTLYYLLGKADPKNRNKKFAITENKQMEVVAEKWLGKFAPKRFLKYLRSKHILSIGCKFNDWFFRFLWYMLIGNIEQLNKGEIAISFTDSESDISLKKYLEKQKVHIELDSKDFLSRITNLLKLHNEEIEILNKRRQSGIFISYPNENKDIAMSLFRKLTDKKFDVWLDNSRLRTGEDFDKKIDRAIEQCQIFIPIISDSINCENVRYFRKEWDILLSYNNLSNKRKIKPILYKIKPQEVENKIPAEFKKSMFDLSENDISKFIKEITEEYNYE